MIEKLLSYKQLVVVFCSMVTFLCVRILNHLPYFHIAFAESICYFELAWYYCNKAQQWHMPLRKLIIYICLGRLMIEIPVRLALFYESLISLFLPVITCISISLATFCFIKRKTWIYIFSFFFIFLIDSIGYNVWREMIKYIK